MVRSRNKPPERQARARQDADDGVSGTRVAEPGAGVYQCVGSEAGATCPGQKLVQDLRRQLRLASEYPEIVLSTRGRRASH